MQQRDARLAGHLREHHAHLVSALSDEELARRVKVGVRRAGEHGIDWDSSLAAYLIIMLRAAPNFDEHRTMRAILGYAGLAPNLRVEALTKVTTEEDWREVVALRDDRAWG
jgi:hypothetical protein